MSISPRLKVYILIGLIVTAIALVIYTILSKKKKNENAVIIAEAIDQSIGVLGTDIDALLFPVHIESGYNTPKADLEKMFNADGGTFMPDSPDAFKEVFMGKTKARIKKIVSDFQKQYGKKLNDHINYVFDNTWGYDSDRYNELLNLIRSAQ